MRRGLSVDRQGETSRLREGWEPWRILLLWPSLSPRGRRDGEGEENERGRELLYTDQRGHETFHTPKIGKIWGGEVIPAIGCEMAGLSGISSAFPVWDAEKKILVQNSGNERLSVFRSTVHLHSCSAPPLFSASHRILLTMLIYTYLHKPQTHADSYAETSSQATRFALPPFLFVVMLTLSSDDH